MRIHVLNRTASVLVWVGVMVCMSACMLRSGARETVMQTAPDATAWAYSFVGADGSAVRQYTDLRPNMRYAVSLSGRVQTGQMQLLLYHADMRERTRLVVRPGSVVVTQAEVTSDAAGRIVIHEYMQAARDGEYQVWIRLLGMP